MILVKLIPPNKNIKHNNYNRKYLYRQHEFQYERHDMLWYPNMPRYHANKGRFYWVMVRMGLITGPKDEPKKLSKNRVKR